MRRGAGGCSANRRSWVATAHDPLTRCNLACGRQEVQHSWDYELAVQEGVDVLAVRNADSSCVRHRGRHLAHHVIWILQFAGEDQGRHTYLRQRVPWAPNP